MGNMNILKDLGEKKLDVHYTRDTMDTYTVSHRRFITGM